jgi:hypothetical protein
MRRTLTGIGTGLALLAAFVLPQLASWRSSSLHAQVAALRAEAQTSRKTWSMGGSLHDVDVAEWSAATSENQLATAADWALAFPSVRAAVKTSGEAALLRSARALRSCVSESAANGPSAGHAPLISEIAAECAVLLKWVSSDS